eukprot:CAMPEP_0171892234 /NCGR_PEP_ID=MMETSP0992-20121227/45196_1 /TAXON_ID=483369 /ORGANISM="non described non described, Strain CCMP2098" /LENGTH=71 /DNA_ID=CAMNT_0012519687 /DNA_START=231 /DNA_END=446 /DNA_ORIENTATION=+
MAALAPGESVKPEWSEEASGSTRTTNEVPQPHTCSTQYMRRANVSGMALEASWSHMTANPTSDMTLATAHT